MSQPYDPYGPQQGGYQTPPPKSSGGKIILIILGVCGGFVVLGCGCCIGLGFFGLNFLGEMVKEGYGDHEAVVEHIGEIESINVNFEDTDQADGGGMVFDVEGSKGNGQIVVYDQQDESFGDADLRVNGEVINLGPSG